MDDTNKLMRLNFSRHVLQKIGGFTTEILIKILEALPPDTSVRSFSEHPMSDEYSILISHDSFPEIPDGLSIPRISATITKKYTTYDIGLTWPKEYIPEKKFEAYLKSIRVKE